MTSKALLRLVLLAYVAVTAGYGLVSLHAQYEEELAEAHQRMAATALLAEEHVLRTVESADLVVRRVVERLAPDGFPAETGRAQWDELEGLRGKLPQLALLALLDRDGTLRLTTQGFPFDAHDLSGGGYFRAHRAGATDAHVGEAVRLRSGEASVFTVSRPIPHPDGGFDGVAVAGIDVAYFRGIYERVQPGSSGALAILRTDGALLLRHPFSPGLATPEAQARIRDWRVFSEFLPTGVTAGTYETGSTTDHIDRIVAFRKVAGLPLVVMAMEAKGDILARLLPGILRSAGMGAVALCFVVGLTLWAFTILRREDAARAALADANARLEAALHQAEQSSTAKSLFLANMSHELRTPLNAIIGFTELLRGGHMGPLNARQDSYLHDIHQAGSHLHQIIAGVLDLSKVAAGRMELLPEPTDFRRLAEAAAIVVKGAAAARGVSIQLRVPPNLPLIEVDPLRFKQVMINLLANAVKFTGPDGRVEVSAVLEGGVFVATVADDGIGMDEDQVQSACEMFGPLASSPVKRHGGSGVGLPLSKALVELHGGVLCIDSRRGAGTRIAIVLPPERVLAPPTGGAEQTAVSA